MITIRTVSEPVEEAGASRRTFEFKDPETSRGPGLVIGILAAAIAYLRSLTPAGNAAKAEGPKDDDATPTEPARIPVLLAASDEVAQLQPEPPREPEAAPHQLLSAPGFVRSAWLVDDEPFNYNRLGARVTQPEKVVSPQHQRPANDNPPPPPPVAPATGGGGGGGGGDDSNSPRNDGTGGRRGNQAPRVQTPVQLPDAVACRPTTLALALLLAGATDPDGDLLSIVSVRASSGTIEQTTDGYVYTPVEERLGRVILTYEISDGTTSVVQVATFDVVSRPPIIGTEGNDRLAGTECDDKIDARGGDDEIAAGGGDDLIYARGGSDVIDGGAGDDLVDAGDGDDIIRGGGGNDIIYGRAGDDIIFGGDGNDRVYGGDGDDVIDGGAGDDVVMAGAGNDVVLPGDGNDTVDGGEGRDAIDGGVGNDLIAGGAGDDIIIDGTGTDVVSGDAGNDVVLASADGDDDVYNGNAGLDVLSYAASRAPVKIDMASGVASGAEIGTDRISEIEKIVGGSGDDTIVAGGLLQLVAGGDGDDTFEFDAFASLPAENIIDRVYEILDLEVGDRILVGEFEIRTSDADADEGSGHSASSDASPDDQFDEIYGGGDQRSFRFRSETREDGEHTLVDVLAAEQESDRPDFVVAYMIDVHGDHHLYYIAVA